MLATDQDGRPLRHRLVELQSSPVFKVVRVDVETGLARTITVTYTYRGYAGAMFPREDSYTIDANYSPSRHAAVRVESFSESMYYWTCSAEALQMLSVDTVAPVFRVEWADSEDQFLRGPRQTVLLAHRTKDLAFSYGEVSVTPQLDLGYIDCAGATIDWKSPIWVAVVAIFPDGSETPVGKPILIPPPSHPSDPPWKKDLLERRMPPPAP